MQQAETEKQTDRQTDRDRQTGRRTERQKADREIDKTIMAEGITRSHLWCSCADTNIILGVKVHLYGFAVSAANLPWTKMLLQMTEWLLILCVYAQVSCKKFKQVMT